MNIQILTGQAIKPVAEHINSPILEAYDWNISDNEDLLKRSLKDFSSGYSMIRTIIEPTRVKGVFCYYTTLLQHNQFKEFIRNLSNLEHHAKYDDVYWEVNYGTIWTNTRSIHNCVRRQIEMALKQLNYPLL